MPANTFYLPFEPVFMEWIQHFLGESGSVLFSHLSALGEWQIMFIIWALLYWCIDKKAGICLGPNLAIGLTINPMIKNVALRLRPYMVHENIQCFRPVEPDADLTDIKAQGYSFPSGHSTHSAIVYGSLGHYYKSTILKVIAFVFPFLVGISRVVVGVHYPTDVICGWACGAVIVFALPVIYEKVGEENTWKVRLCTFLIAAIGIFYCRTDDYFSGLGFMLGLYLGIEFEKRFVNFATTRNPILIVARICGGFLSYLILDKILKLPFTTEFLHSGTFAAFMIRFLRYAIIVFFMTAIYPLIFSFLESKMKMNEE